MMPARGAPPALRLPHVARALVAAVNRAHRARAELALPGAEGVRLRLNPGPAGDASPDPAATARLEIRAGGEQAVLHAPWRLVEDLVEDFAPQVRLDLLSPALRALVLEASLQRGVELLEQAAGRGVTLGTLDDAAADPRADGAMGYAVRVGYTGEDWVVRLECPARLWEEIVSAWPVAARDPDGLTMPAIARVGTLALPGRVLASLRPGDVLLGEGGIDTQAGRLVLAGGFGADMVKVGETWLITEAPATMQSPADDDTDRDLPDGAEADLSEIPVRLDFDVGSLDLPLGRLREMGAGTILDLQRDTRDFVGITANGRRIGRGELVDIDGTLGVRITRIFGRE